MDNATVRVRPLRFAFVVEPKDKVDLQRIFEINSALWGGVFNFIVPVFKQVPQRYREKYCHFTQNPGSGILSAIGIFRQLRSRSRRRGNCCSRG